MTSAAITTELQVGAPTTDDAAAVRDWIRAVGADASAVDDALNRLDRAAGWPRFALVTAATDTGLVGFAAAGLVDGMIHLDPVVVAPGLPRLDADRVCHRLADALLDAQDLPWADVSVPPASPAVPALLRAGWRPVKTDPAAAYDVLSGADAS